MNDGRALAMKLMMRMEEMGGRMALLGPKTCALDGFSMEKRCGGLKDDWGPRG